MSQNNPALQHLMDAEAKAKALFDEVATQNIIAAGCTEREVNEKIYQLAFQMYGIEKYWHKRIVRAGANTLLPYAENPSDLTIQTDDIVFLDFGPIFEDWEADFGRTFVIGNDPVKLQLRRDIESAWLEVKDWILSHTFLTGAQAYSHIQQVAKNYGWEYTGEIAGHLIGHFPHERLEPKNYGLYIHPENHNNIFEFDAQGKPRHWILEIHFVDRKRQIGGFFEQILM